MSVNTSAKQKHAVAAVTMALLGVGGTGRAVGVTVAGEGCGYGDGHGQKPARFAVFVASAEGVEPFYATGGTLAEAVRNALHAIKSRPNGTATDESGVAPF